jgi:hypothetical protein
VDETYRMLGREHELDLEREARRHRLAAAVPARRTGRWAQRALSALALAERVGQSAVASKTIERALARRPD